MIRGLKLPCYFVHISAVDLHTVGSGEHTVKSSLEPLAVAQSAFTGGLYSLFSLLHFHLFQINEVSRLRELSRACVSGGGGGGAAGGLSL